MHVTHMLMKLVQEIRGSGESLDGELWQNKVVSFEVTFEGVK